MRFKFLEKKEEKRLCILLKYSNLGQISLRPGMHNLKASYEHILHLVQTLFSSDLLDGHHFQIYKRKPILSDCQVITLSILAEALSFDSELHFFRVMKGSDLAHIPVGDRSNFNRRRRRLSSWISDFSHCYVKAKSPQFQVAITDTIPIPVCRLTREKRLKICSENQDTRPMKGYHASHKEYFVGYKLGLLITDEGLPFTSHLLAANLHDTKLLKHISEKGGFTDFELLADKGFISAGLQLSLWNTDRIQLTYPLRSNMSETLNLWTPTKRYQRKRIEIENQAIA